MFSTHATNPRTGSEKPRMLDLKIPQSELEDAHGEISHLKKFSRRFLPLAKLSISFIILCGLSRLWQPTCFLCFSRMDSTKEKPLNPLSGKPVIELSDSKSSDSNYVQSVATCVWGFSSWFCPTLTLLDSGAFYFSTPSTWFYKTLGVALRSNELDGGWICRPFGS